MLIFDFKCEDCGSEHELYVKKTTVPKCPKCGSENQTKLITGVGMAYVKNECSQEDLANYTYAGHGQKGDLRGTKW